MTLIQNVSGSNPRWNSYTKFFSWVFFSFLRWRPGQ